ncbi:MULTISPECIES: protein kinase [unclassified Streptomyces]|uniref:protein kinase domain-containing protein n=1 Tax=unclassified Streptomyces TaxID=2593676 RepID=UPI00136AE9A8|nr:protein kinase [Streptomyces sp. SID335]MYZ15111.1 protein kinase [Streptomyces sp. SID337]NDZ89981.1 protein kinase [Streptomyces sp. SID10115]NEA02567.1 protein kinase [Streptomyces sp. SID10116]NEB47877.1 protein kinase [Streptomyces sp. SID339]
MRGRLLNGRYELLAPVGAGGMGEVWRARDTRLGREVAVKLLLPGPTTSEDERRELLARFRQEARAAASLDSPYIVAVHDHGEDDGTPYLVMALVQGRSLDQILRERVRVPVADALRWAADICRALDVAHAAGIVHRDIKPGNVMVTPDGTAKVVDFGIATFMERAAGDARLTRSGQLPFGSVPYLAPERFRQEPGDGRTDLYALGCVLYELCTGRPPFVGSAAGVMHHHINDEPLRPSAARPEVPRPVERLILDLLAKDPADRPADAATTLARLLSATGPLPAPLVIQKDDTPPNIQDEVTRPPSTTKTTTVPVGPDPARPARRLLLPAALILALGIPTGLGIRALAAPDTSPEETVFKIGVAHSYRHVGGSADGGNALGTYATSEYKQFTTQQLRTVESAFAETLGDKHGEKGRFRVVPVTADPDVSSRELLAEHPDMLAVIGDTVDFSWVHDTDEAFLPEISTCHEYAHAGGAFAIPADDARQGEAIARYLRSETDARRVLVAEDRLWVDREDGIGTALRRNGVTTEALDVTPDKVKTSQIRSLVAEARADAVVVPTGTPVDVWAEKLRAGGFEGPVISQGDQEGTCADSKERSAEEKRDGALPDGVIRVRNYAAEPDDNLPARGNEELYDGALALAKALTALPEDDTSPTSLRHTLDRELEHVSVNGVQAEVTFEKRRSARARPVWFDRRDENRWEEIGKVAKTYTTTRHWPT